jgi:hypothetical protein
MQQKWPLWAPPPRFIWMVPYVPFQALKNESNLNEGIYERLPERVHVADCHGGEDDLVEGDGRR